MRSKFQVLLIALFIVFYSTSKAQLATPPGPDLQEKAAGYELVKATKHFYIGTALELSGSLVFLIGAADFGARYNRGGAGLALLGGLSFISGAVLTIESYSHIGRAGKILMQRNDMTFGPTNNGMGLSVQF